MSVKQGRRICKAKAIENPTCPEIRDVCQSQKYVIEQGGLTQTDVLSSNNAIIEKPLDYPLKRRHLNKEDAFHCPNTLFVDITIP